MIALLLFAGLYICPQAIADDLININFGVNADEGAKVGPAATGNSPNDYWNLWSRDVTLNPPTYRDRGTIPNLKFADGSLSGVRMSITNAAGAWGTGVSDGMMRTYLYPLAAGDLTVTLSGLAAGSYEVFVYAHGLPASENAMVQLWDANGGSARRTSSSANWDSPGWTEGKEYVLFGDVQVGQAGTFEVRIKRDASSQRPINGIQIRKKAVPPVGDGTLININFGVNADAGAKVGPAATGDNEADVWNLWSRDLSLNPPTYRASGTIENLQYANGSLSGVKLSVTNAAGAWGTGVPDGMMRTYLYPLSAGDLTVNLDRLEPGRYDVYVYAHGQPASENARVQLLDANGSSERLTGSDANWNPDGWVEGKEYVLFSEAVVGTSQSLRIAIKPGASSQRPINGIQIRKRSTPPPPSFELININFGINVDAGAKVGPAATGISAEDLWNLYSRDNPTGGYRPNGTLSDLLAADGRTTSVDMAITNAAGAWGTGKPDGMLRTYLYPLGSGPMTLELSSLPAGAYDVYVYAHGFPPTENAQITLLDSQGTSTLATSSDADWDPAGWVEGKEYVLFRHALVSQTGKLSFVIRGGAAGLPVINGMQIRKAQTEPPPQRQLINVNFGINNDAGAKVGKAAVGWTDQDRWNLYSRDAAVGYKQAGTIPNLEYSDGSSSGASLYITNAPGAWGTLNLDGMLRTYLYPLGPGPIEIELNSLPEGEYEAYIYAHGQPATENARIRVIHSGGQEEESTSPDQDWDPEGWVEGKEYVAFRGVVVRTGAKLRFVINGGVAGLPVVNGLQLLKVEDTLPPPLTFAEVPKGGLISPGGTITLTATVAAGADATFEWFKDGKRLDGQTSASLTLSDAVESQTGLYTVVATKGGERVEASAYVKISPALDSAVLTIAGSDEGYLDSSDPLKAQFRQPNGIAVDNLGTVYVADGHNHVIRRVRKGGSVTTLAGQGSPGKSDGEGTAALFNFPLGLTKDRNGDLWIADSENELVRKIFLTAERPVVAYAGSTEGYLDGVASQAKFNFPNDLVVDRHGNVFVSEFHNHTIRKISPDGEVKTFAGSNSPGYIDATGTNARFNQPAGIAMDAAGNLYVTEWANHRIRKISPQGVVSTVAGTGAPGFKDGPKDEAQFNTPDGITVTSKGILAVTEHLNHTVRLIYPDGYVRTLAGNGTPGIEDGTVTARFNSPGGIATGPDDSLFVADTGNHRVRRISWASGFTPLPEGHIEIELSPSIIVHGELGSTYNIEATDNVGRLPWINVGQITLTAPASRWFDPRPATGHNRMYRAVKVVASPASVTAAE